MTQESEQRIVWDKSTEEKFHKLLEQIPALIRGIAETRVNNKAQALVKNASRFEITEKDMIDAFFAETPPGFLTAMKSGMQELGINYEQYGYK